LEIIEKLQEDGMRKEFKINQLENKVLSL